MNTIISSIGSPLKASTAAAMTNYDKVYVYTGEEQGYTAGNWYYYDGNNWVSGGVYNSAAISTDKTLSVEDEPADAAAVGDVVSRVAATESTVYDLGTQVGTALNNVSAIDNDITDLQIELGMMQDLVNTKADHFEVGEDGLLYIYANEELIAELGPFAGGGGGGGQGGGGGSTNNAELTARAAEGQWLTTTISSSAACTITFTWSSIEEDTPTGDGSLTVYVNGSARIVRGIQQGEVTVNVTNYLQNGRNSVRIAVYDVYDNMRTINFTVNVVSLSIRSTFDNSVAYNGAFSFQYFLSGDIEKTSHIEVDGTQVATETTTLSDRQLTATIPAQSHGTHVIEAWCTAVINDETITSNVLRYEVICIAAGNSDPIIISSFTETTVEQWTNINIKYNVYDPSGLTASVVLKANNVTVNSITVDRTEQTWSYRADTEGSLVLQIVCGETTKTFNLTVTESSATIGAVTEGLELYLTSQGRSNGEANPSLWSYESISATLSGFNYVSNGWITDTDGNVALRLSGSARVTIPLKIFSRDFKADGKTIEFEFATRNIMNYDSPIISCMNGNRGIEITSQMATLRSEQKEISTQFKEDEHVRIAFVIEKVTEQRLIYVYINGVLSGVDQYPQGDDFVQLSPVNITIGSDYATTDIYNIRVYSTNLNRQQVLGNWIADTQNVDDMLDRYTRNNIFDAYYHIVINKLPTYVPYMIITCPELPPKKGDKRTCSVVYVDPAHPSKSFTAENVQIDVQGTSSQYYPRKNYKMKYKSGFINSSGRTQEKYQLTDDCLPTNVFCMKADFASSEGANNVELVRAYCEACPYETPAQEEEPLVRQGIDGFGIVMFYNNGSTTEFIGKYNFNLDKASEECFGFVEGDESWEIKTHASSRVLWKVSDFTSMGVDDSGNPIPAWLNDFEARYPDTDPAYTDYTQLKTFSDWICQTDTDAATGNNLAESVTYDGTTYTKDTAEYRLAKFKAEIGNYVEVDSMLFYYLFTELFLMVDSRSKNMFPSFMGEVVG